MGGGGGKGVGSPNGSSSANGLVRMGRGPDCVGWVGGGKGIATGIAAVGVG